MSILTHLMKYARKDTIGSNCILFWPGPPEDVSGTSITDIIQGGVITDAGGDFDTASAFAGSADVQDSGLDGSVIPVSSGDCAYVLVYCAKMATDESLMTFGLTDTGGGGQLMSVRGDKATINDDSGAQTDVAINLGASVGETLLVAAGYTPSTGVLNGYGGSKDTTAVALTATETANAARIANGVTFTGQLDVDYNTNGFNQAGYGAALFRFQAGLPSDLIAGLQEILDSWPLGRKLLPASWKGLG